MYKLNKMASLCIHAATDIHTIHNNQCVHKKCIHVHVYILTLIALSVCDETEMAPDWVNSLYNRVVSICICFLIIPCNIKLCILCTSVLAVFSVVVVVVLSGSFPIRVSVVVLVGKTRSAEVSIEAQICLR